MPITIDYFSNVTDSNLSQTVFNSLMEGLKLFEGKRIKITVTDFKEKRTVRQNRLFWMYVTIIADELGYDKEEMAEIIKFKFLLTEKVIEETGEVMQYVESTTKLNKDHFRVFIDKIIRWSAEQFNIVLPLPEDQKHDF